jgi:hypothetical protein
MKASPRKRFGLLAAVALAVTGLAVSCSGSARPLPKLHVDNGIQAAVVHHWGRVIGGDEFNGTHVNTSRWYVYDGAGDSGHGRRLPRQVTEKHGYLSITGRPNGDTGGISWKIGQRYGRWEARMRVVSIDSGYQAYKAVLLLWPDSNEWPAGGEVDYVESYVGAGNLWANLHYPNGTAAGGVRPFEHRINLSKWHDYAVEWTPQHISGYLDGRRWFSSLAPIVQPAGPMHQCIQLDDTYSSGLLNRTVLEVDWVRMYAAAR